jgi:AraC-like DNA-binding protein
MQELLLIRVRYAQRFAATLERLGHESGSSLRRAHVSAEILRIGDGFMPVNQLYRFLEDVISTTGRVDLGLYAGIRRRREHSEFSRDVAAMPTLFQSLQTLCANSKVEDGTAEFRIEASSSSTWLCCGTVAAGIEAARQIELFRYAALIEVIRQSAGSDWLPTIVRFQSPDHAVLGSAALLKNVHTEFSSPELAIALPNKLLGESAGPVAVQTDGYSPEPAPPAEESFRTAVKEVIQTHMLAGHADIGQVAASIGIAVRSLQRNLAQCGTRFSCLLGETRIETAQIRLHQDEVILQNLAIELGYQHGTHFSRAFKKACGVSPSEFRSKLQ